MSKNQVTKVIAYQDIAGNLHTEYPSVIKANFGIECMGVINRHLKDKGISNTSFNTSQMAQIMAETSKEIHNLRASFNSKMSGYASRTKKKAVAQ